MRFIAPLALIAAVVGVLAVVQISQRETSDATPTTTVSRSRARRAGRRKARAKTYVVKAGDNLTAISERTNVPLETIEELNPTVNAQSLSVGQKLRLTR